MTEAALVFYEKVGLEGKVTKDRYQYVEGGVHKDGRVTFHIETDKFQLYLEFESEEEFNRTFLESLKRQMEESKQRQ